MMCLAVRSSIQPTSAATGTDDDMGGNDKADALTGTDLERNGQNWGLQRNFFFKPGQFDRYWPFMASPEPECTSVELEKRQVWPNRDISALSLRLPPPEC